ncbi:MAG TPA: 4-hydroxy-tetrahydrodipicolinate reductase [Bacteroidales bacterium]|nr:4-hydroxy-tetrahydrodipicolinate reductase [Bacteroidales bacterium]
MIKVAIIGYGKMGHEVEKILQKWNIPIAVIIDSENDWIEKWDQFLQSSVAIEFSSPEIAPHHFKKCFENQIPLVSGTTGWYSQFFEIIDMASQLNSSFIYGTNFSIGANLFFSSVAYLSKLINIQSQYDCSIEETHHITKKDAPSGTAITTAELILQELNSKTEWVKGNPLNHKQLPIYSYRVGEAIGEHNVTFSSNEDSLSIVHRANNRVGFATGAVKAAIWLLKNPGIYNISEIFMKI